MDLFEPTTVFETIGGLICGILLMTVGIRYWRIPPLDSIPKSKTGKLLYRAFYCTIGGFLIYSTLSFLIKEFLK